MAATINKVRGSSGRERGQVVGLAVVTDCPTEAEATRLAAEIFTPASASGDAARERIEAKQIGANAWHVAAYYQRPVQAVPENLDYEAAIETGQFRPFDIIEGVVKRDVAELFGLKEGSTFTFGSKGVQIGDEPAVSLGEVLMAIREMEVKNGIRDVEVAGLEPTEA